MKDNTQNKEWQVSIFAPRVQRCVSFPESRESAARGLYAEWLVRYPDATVEINLITTQS